MPRIMVGHQVLDVARWRSGTLMRRPSLRTFIGAVGLLAVVGGGTSRTLAQGASLDPYYAILDGAHVLDGTDLDAVATAQRQLLSATGVELQVAVVPSTAAGSGLETVEQQLVEYALSGVGSKDALLFLDIEDQVANGGDWFWGNSGKWKLDLGPDLQDRISTSRSDCVTNNDLGPVLVDRNWSGAVLTEAVWAAADGLYRAITGGRWIDPQALIGSWSAPSIGEVWHYEFAADGSYRSDHYAGSDDGLQMLVTELGTYRVTDCTLTLTATSTSAVGDVVAPSPTGPRDLSIRFDPITDRPGENILYLDGDNFLIDR